MNTMAVNIKTVEKVGVLHTIASKLSELNFNILYTHLFLKDDHGRIYMEVSGVDDENYLLEKIGEIPDVISVKIHKTLKNIFGKRIIVIGDGIRMAETLQAAIMEAEIHNRSGECISVDGMIINGGLEIQQAVKSLTKLPRVEAVVLSGSMMGGLITKEILKLKDENKDLIIISLDMIGDLTSVVDHVINDTNRAGTMAVKLVSDKNYYNDEILDNKFLRKISR